MTDKALKEYLKQKDTAMLKNTPPSIEKHAWKKYLTETLGFKLERKLYEWKELKPTFDIAFIDYIAGKIDFSVLSNICKEFLKHLVFTEENKYYFLLLELPLSEFGLIYFDYEIKGNKITNKHISKTNSYLNKCLAEASLKYFDKKSYSETEFKVAATSLFRDYFNGEFTDQFLELLMPVFTTKVEKQFDKFENEELGWLLYWLEEVSSYGIKEVLNNRIDIKKVLGLSSN